jgi:hypothetical protein
MPTSASELATSGGFDLGPFVVKNESRSVELIEITMRGVVIDVAFEKHDLVTATMQERDRVRATSVA